MPLPGPREIERAGLRAWPGLEVEYDGSWVRRAANGYTQRANSVLSLDPADIADAAGRIEASSAWFSARGLTPIFRVTPLAGAEVVSVLDAAGWRSVGASLVLAMELSSAEHETRGHLYEVLDPAFLAAQQRLRSYSAERLGKLRALLSVLDVPARGIVVRSEQGEPLASLLMSIADGIVVTGNVITAETHRRRGNAAMAMRCGLAWARNCGARYAALNVARDNAAGQALYRSLGYAPVYGYVYRMPPSP